MPKGRGPLAHRMSLALLDESLQALLAHRPRGRESHPAFPMIEAAVCRIVEGALECEIYHFKRRNGGDFKIIERGPIMPNATRLFAAVTLSFVLLMSGCATPGQSPAPTNTGESEIQTEDFSTVDYKGVSLKLNPNWEENDNSSYGPSFYQQSYGDTDTGYVSVMAFKKVGDQEAKAKTFSGHYDQSYDLDYEDEDSVSLSDGTSLSVKSAKNGDYKFTFAYAIRDDGYGFAIGIKSDADGRGDFSDEVIDFVLNSISFDVTELEAAIPPDDGTFTVTFYDGISTDGISTGGTVLKEEKVQAGGNATPPADPNMPGYVFAGWKGDYNNVRSNMAIIAQWENVGGTDVSMALSDDDKGKLVANAQDVVKELLKSPSSAKFSWSFDDYEFYSQGKSFSHQGCERYVIKGFVDSDNSYGASVRSKFLVTMDYKSDDGSYYVIEKSIG